MTSKKFRLNVSSLATGLVVTSLAAQAFAQCLPTGFNLDPSGDVTVYCVPTTNLSGGGQWYFAQPGICGNTILSVEMYTSMIQGAILSSKLLDISPNQSSGCSYHIQLLQLDQCVPSGNGCSLS